jgi:cytochrome P450
MGLIMEFLLFIFVRDSFQARELIVKRFVGYFHNKHHEEGSALIRARYKHNVDHKIPLEDIARFETAGAIAILTNTSPACFWLIYHIYVDTVALEECRKEVSRILSKDTITTPEGSVNKTNTLDMSQVKQACNMLLSGLKEVLRLHLVGVSTRLVMEDRVLDDKFLLKKGAPVMIPGPVQHMNTSI